MPVIEPDFLSPKTATQTANKISTCIAHVINFAATSVCI